MDIDAEHARAKCPQCGEVRAIEPATGAPRPHRREPLGMPPYALWLFLGGVSLCGIMFPVLKWWEGHIKPLDEPKVVAAPAKLVWDVTRPPIVRDLDGDGIADLIGRYRPDTNSAAKMHVGAFSGKTLAPLWTTDSLGDWADALDTVQIALAGNALLTTDSRGAVDLRVPASGALVHQFALVSPAVEACGAVDGTMRFWVKTREGRGFEIEDSVPQPTPSPRPSWCAPPPGHGPQAQVLQLGAAPAVEGFSPALVLNEGINAVAIGVKQGAATLVGFDPSRSGVRWQRPLADHVTAAPMAADLVDGVLYVPYSVAAGRRLQVVDASSGKLRWDAPIPGRGAGTSGWERLIAGGARVYVPEPLGLAVFDAASGRRVGTLGE